MTKTISLIVPVFNEQAKVLYEAGCDLFAVESMLAVLDAVTAVEAVRSVPDCPDGRDGAEGDLAEELFRNLQTYLFEQYFKGGKRELLDHDAASGSPPSRSFLMIS